MGTNNFSPVWKVITTCSPHMLFAMQGHLDKNSPNPGFVLLTFYNLHEGKVRNFGQISDA
jgi:hypothetical protein